MCKYILLIINVLFEKNKAISPKNTYYNEQYIT